MSLPPDRTNERYDLIAATLSFIEEFYEVVLFGGKERNVYEPPVNETRIIRIGKYDINEEKCN